MSGRDVHKGFDFFQRPEVVGAREPGRGQCTRGLGQFKRRPESRAMPERIGERAAQCVAGLASRIFWLENVQTISRRRARCQGDRVHAVSEN